ncbi:hypothetical protein [Streptomyces sp. URMC 123]|uniref:hypothetical protein n=1 Tax=Streptomyces sp. URMC 123 TaxID=3423403 RepID=UPI003F1AAC1F
MTVRDRDPELRKELAATLDARRELGTEYESEFVETFLEKVEQRIDSEVELRVRRHLAEQRMEVARGGRPPHEGRSGFGERFGFGALSLVLAVPLSAIGVANADLAGLLIAWAGIVAVNVVHMMGRLPWQNAERTGRGPESTD